MRAIAVGGVVLFHAFPWLLSGGFIGVDVFFVLSGYLLTGIICSEIEQGTFSLSKFYERRFRRIMPALVFVVAITTVAALAILTPMELEDYGKSLIGVGTFTANFIFWWDTGYFSPNAMDKPLLHMWSLAIEEQFYIIWPIILVFIQYRNNKSSIRIFTIITVAASLMLATLSVDRRPDLAFYMLPTRAWELGIGAMLSTGVIPTIRIRVVREIEAAIGLLIIAIPMAFYTESIPFPGIAAVPPCLGTILILHSGNPAVTHVSRLLSSKPIVAVGQISYSLYLWHWPMLVLPRLALSRLLTTAEAISAVAIAFVLAVASTRFVEARFRRQGAWPTTRKAALTISGLAAATIVATGVALVCTHGFSSIAGREVQIADRATNDVNPRRSACHVDRARVTGEPGNIEGCLAGKPDAIAGYDVLLLGDSHADHLMPGLEALAGSAGMEIRQATVSGCSPLLRYIQYAAPAPKCMQINNNSLKEANAQPDIDAIVLSSSWSAILAEIYANTADKDRIEASNQFKAGMQLVLNEIRSQVPEARIVIVGSTPDFRFVPAKCFARMAKFI